MSQILRSEPRHGHRHASPAPEMPNPSTRAARGGWWAVAAAIVVCVAAGAVFGHLPNSELRPALHEVTRGDLLVTLTARGTVECQKQTDIQCRVYSYDSNPTQIIYLVPNGTTVREGDLLAEFDSSVSRERIDYYQLSHDKDVARLIQTEARYKNYLIRFETRLAEAELAVKLAKMQLKMYEDGEDGTYQIALQDVARQAQEARSGVVGAQAELHLRSTERQSIETLYKLGYRNKGDLDQAVFKSLEAENSLSTAANELSSTISTKQKLENFEYPMQKMSLEGDVRTAKTRLEQVKLDNASQLVEEKARLVEAKRSVDYEVERLKRYHWQLENCKIYAPHDGMAVYAPDRGGDDVVREGDRAYYRQTILTLPELSKMKVEVPVYESASYRLKPGQPATIHVEAIADRTYHGAVESIATMPTQVSRYVDDVRVYHTSVPIEGAAPELRPGMTAIVELEIADLHDVVLAPVESLVEEDDHTYAFVATSLGFERRDVTLGDGNEEFVEIRDGLEPGEYVARDPSVLLGE